jgi:hypothetical protein
MQPTSSHRANAFGRNTSVNTVDLIQRVLHHPDFNAAEVDHDLHERLMRAVADGDIEVINMWEEGDGPQDNTFVKHKVAKVLTKLISDERMAGRQHFI